MEECKKVELEACELEAIRPEGNKCGSNSGCSDTSTQTTLASYNYQDKLPGVLCVLYGFVRTCFSAYY